MPRISSFFGITIAVFWADHPRARTSMTQARRRRSPFIVEQVRTVVEDIGVDAVKTGMLGDVATIDAVFEALDIIPDATRLRRSRHSGSSASALASRTPRTATTKPTSARG